MKTCVIILSFVLSLSAFAAANDNIGISTILNEDSNISASDPQGFWLFGGFNTGYVTTSTDTAGYVQPNGFQWAAKGIGSYYFQDRMWVADAGVGFQFNRLSQGSKAVKTDALMFEFSGRYRFNRNWQLGPTLSWLIGGDTSFGLENTSMALMLGVGGMYEFVGNQRWPIRAGGRLMTDLTISDRQVYAFVVDLQIGFPVTRSRGYELQSETRKQKPLRDDSIFERSPAIERMPTKKTPDQIVRELNVSLPTFNLQPNQIRVQEQDSAFLIRLANKLQNHRDLFEEIQIKGYSDSSQGSDEFNKRLAISRAMYVGQALQVGGLKDRKFDYVAITGEPNSRKVELMFRGVKNPELLNNLIQESAKPF